MPVLGFGRKRAWEHAQDATRPRIRPVWPSAQRRGVRRGAAVLDRRCAVPGLRCGPRAMSTRAIGRGGTGKTHRAWNWTGKWRSGVGVVLRRQRARRRSEAGRCRGSPGVWILRFDAGWRCEVVPWVRDARDSPAACKWGGGRLTRGGGSVPSMDIVVVAPRFWAASSGRVRRREGSRGQLKAARHPGRACTRYPRRQSRQRFWLDPARVGEASRREGRSEGLASGPCGGGVARGQASSGAAGPASRGMRPSRG